MAPDYLTRYAETAALPSGTAVEVTKCFVQRIVLRCGAPEVLITDQWTAFIDFLIQQTLHYSRTKHRAKTPYHPQTNGLTERLNKTLADMVSMYVDVEHKRWDEILPYATFSYNTAVQKTTSMTHFCLVYGREAASVLDAILPYGDHGISDVAPFLQRAEETRQLAPVRISSGQDFEDQRYTLHHRHVEYTACDRVWVWIPVRQRGLSEKLLRW